MAWTTPKTDWATETNVSYVHFNDIGNNLLYLKDPTHLAGFGLGPNVDGSLDVNADNSSLEVSADTLRVKAAGVTDAMNASIYMKLVNEQAISGSAVTEVSFTGLSFANNIYNLDMVLYNAYAGTTNFYLFCNGDETLTNYYNQALRIYGTSQDQARSNSPLIDNVTIGQTLSAYLKCSQPYAGASPGSPRFGGHIDKEAPASVEFKIKSITWTGTAAVTSLKVKAGAANAIGIGSRFWLWGRSK